jgi:hypothetical protein
MALTFSKTASGVMGDKRYFLGTVAFDASYPTGGEAVTAAELEFQLQVDAVIINAQSSLVPTKVVSYDPSTGKLVINVEDGTSGIMAEAANASDQSTVVDVQFIAFGE